MSDSMNTEIPNGPVSQEDSDELLDVQLGVQEESALSDVATGPSQDTGECDTDSSARPNGSSYLQRYVSSMASHSWKHLLTAFVIAAILSVVGMTVGNFEVSVENDGWNSRGTFIADRHTQLSMVWRYAYDLFYDQTGDVWNDLLNNVQVGWEVEEDASDRRRRLLESAEADSDKGAADTRFPWLNDKMRNVMQRQLEETPATSGGALDGCNITWYTSGQAEYAWFHLWSIWKTKSPETSIVDPQVLYDICVSEQITQTNLERLGLCYGYQEGTPYSGCSDGHCYPPFSIVFFAHLAIGDTSIALSCDELKEAWTDSVDQVQSELETCVQAIDLNYEQVADARNESCPHGFSTTMLDELFGQNGEDVIRYSSSVFATGVQMDTLYDFVPAYDRAAWSDGVIGAYDSRWEELYDRQVDDAFLRDLMLAFGSAVITSVAIVIHTRSFWLALVGVLQIVLSFPLAFFVYNIVAGVEFYPFLNFMGIFVVFALGADDVFVAVDKWKNARLDHKNASTEEIATIALPDAAGAMFLTSVTTAVAFFATAICRVAPLKCFAIFSGLLIVFDYLMCCFLVFPALCIYDKWLVGGVKNFFVSCHYCRRTETQDEDADIEDEEKQSLIRRILLALHDVLHFSRWPLLVLCIAALVVCILVAATLDLPNSNDVRLLKESDSQYEQNFQWRKNLLSDVLDAQAGSFASVIWGVRPADTGDHKNPAEWSQLVLDDTFDPAPKASQEYLAGFCDSLFSNEFAAKVSKDYECPISEFDAWLQEESASASPSEAYTTNCGGATSVPVAQESFHACIIAWSKQAEDLRVLQRDGQVKIMFTHFLSRVRYDSPYDDLDKEWHLIEDWMKEQLRDFVPDEVDGMFFSSEDYWWYDTNGEMLRTAYGAAAIALTAAAIVVMISSRSIVICVFSIFTIGYILTSVTAMLVGIGWTLGFLEAILFAILIGISCDFVIHFGHAYTFLPGKVSSTDRTKYALIRMGPSILAAAATSAGSAIIMLFTVITFFEKFAVMLFFTILQATLGSFVVFLTLCDCVGPSEPTYLVDMMIHKMKLCFCKEKEPINKEKEPIQGISDDAAVPESAIPDSDPA